MESIDIKKRRHTLKMPIVMPLEKISLDFLKSMFTFYVRGLY